MPQFSGPVIAIGQRAFKSSSTKIHPLGTIGATEDGRLFRYVLAGASALVVGNAIQTRAEDVDHDNITVRATAIGASLLLITTGASGGALDANEYADGYAAIDTTAGLGYFYKILEHDAISASTNGSLKVVPGDEVEVALDTSSKITLVAHPCSKVIQCPVTTATGMCIGGCIYPIAATEYGWVQFYGPGAALIAGTPAVGQPVVSVAATAGALAVHSAELPTVATMMVTGRDGKVLPVFWNV